MRTLLKIVCQKCNRSFLKYEMYIKENARLGHSLYCSKKCQFEYRKTGKLLVCNNSLCKERFYRAKNDILKYNYCSQSCAAIVNNQRYPKWPKRYCILCQKEFKNRGPKYCSSRCGRLAISNYRSLQSKYSQEQIISALKDFNKQHKRAPAKREMLDMVGCATNKFGSWTATIQAAGLEPNRSHDNRMYRRTRTKAHDGHECDSISEAIIDNWLVEHNISHIRDVKYPSTNHKSDWAIDNNKVFIEYFGLAKDSQRYDRSVKSKINICRINKIRLIGIYPKDLYPINRLDKILNKFIPDN